MKNHITKIYHITLVNVEPDIEFITVIDYINKKFPVWRCEIAFKAKTNRYYEIDITMKENII